MKKSVSLLAGVCDWAEDTPEIRSAQQCGDFRALGDALQKQMRFREAATAYSIEISDFGEDRMILRSRADAYLHSLQGSLARKDYLLCLDLGEDPMEMDFALGMCEYYEGRFFRAMAYFEDALPISDDETGISLIYWHTICACKLGIEPSLLLLYSPAMHLHRCKGYENAVRMFRKMEYDNDSSQELLYALAIANPEETGSRLAKILDGPGNWRSLVFLAAFQDAQA